MELSCWLFSVQKNCEMVGITKPVYMVRLVVSGLKQDTFTWWHQLANCGDDYPLGTLVWSDFNVELVMHL